MTLRTSLAIALAISVVLLPACVPTSHTQPGLPPVSAVGIGEPLVEVAPWYSLAARPQRSPKPPRATPTPAPTAAPTATPTPSAAPTASPVPTSIYAPAIDAERLALAQRVLTIANEHRAAAGLAPLALEGPYPGTPSRMGVATFRSEDMRDRNYFAHTDPDGHSPFWHLTQAGIGYSTAGENIAYGYATPEAVMTAWMNSTGHRANILNGSFGRLGVGIAQGGSGGIYWTQIFTN